MVSLRDENSTISVPAVSPGSYRDPSGFVLSFVLRVPVRDELHLRATGGRFL